MLVKEELVDYLTKGYIHVSRQDYLFFSNLIKIANEGRVTTGQNKLLDKLIEKYKRQLIGQRLDTEYLKKLSWRFTLLESKPEYTQAHLSLENNRLVLRIPYNKKFISILKGLGTNKTFEWDKELKAYVSPIFVFALRSVVRIATEVFGEVKLDKQLQSALDELKQYENCIWAPTFVESNGNYYIGAINEQIYEIVKNIELNLSAPCLYTLSKLAINTDINLNPEQKFAITFNNQFDISQIEEFVQYTKACNIKEVGILNSNNKLKSHSYVASMVDKFKNADIKVVYHGYPYTSMLDDCNDTELVINVVGNGYNLMYFGPHKIVKLLNSTPIQVK